MAAHSVEAVHMRWVRKVTGYPLGGDSEGTSDDWVRFTYEIPSTWSMLSCRRLSYLSPLRKSSPFLKALLQWAPQRHPWVTQIICDLQELRRDNPKLAGLPPPECDVDAWISFAIAHPHAWKAFLFKQKTSYMPDDLLAATLPCMICGTIVEVNNY